MAVTNNVWEGFGVFGTMTNATDGRITVRKSALHIVSGQCVCPSSVNESPITEAHTSTIVAPAVRRWK